MSREKRVVTVTLNPAIDHTVAVPNFRVGEVNRVRSSQLDAGGKGVNVAAFLSDFGRPVTVTGFLGAGNDEIFRRFFAQKGIEDRFVRIAGQTRTGVKIIDEVRHQTTDINFPGETPSRADIERLFGILAELAPEHDCFVLAGSIPAGVEASIYREMVETLSGKYVALDTSGGGLRQALGAGPSLIKPNVDELAELVGERPATPAATARVARAVGEQYRIATVVVSMGKAGAILVEGSEALWAEPPPVEVKSTVGAGDAMVAGLVAGTLGGLSLADRARLATAFSVSALAYIGSGLPSLETVRSAMARVTVQEVSNGSS